MNMTEEPMTMNMILNISKMKSMMPILILVIHKPFYLKSSMLTEMTKKTLLSNLLKTLLMMKEILKILEIKEISKTENIMKELKITKTL